MLFRWLMGYEAQRKRALKLAPDGPLKSFLTTPLPDINRSFLDIPILSVDFETTGLDAINDKLLSIGHCQVKSGRISLASSHHQIINTKQKLKPENVIVHQITDQQQQRGIALETAIEQLLTAFVWESHAGALQSD